MKEHLPFAQKGNTAVQRILFFLIILFLPTQLGKHFWTNASFVTGIRVDYLSPTIYFTDILIFLLALSVCFDVPKRFTNAKQIIDVSALFLRQYWPYALFLLTLCTGIILSKSPWNGWYSFAKLLEFSFLGFYGAHFFKREESFALLVWPLIAGVIFESALAIAQFFHQGSINGIFYFFGERNFTSDTPGIANASLNGHLILRPYATFSHPNVLAAYLLIAMTILLFNFEFHVFNRQTIFNTLKLLVLAAGTFALFLTLSRAAIILWIIIFFICFALWLKKRIPTVFSILLSTIFFCLITTLFFLSPFSYRFTQLSFANESIVQRETLSNIAIRMIIDHPLFGVGLANFLPTLAQYLFPNTANTPLQPVHNIFLLIAVETGIPGICLVIWFLYKTLKRSFQLNNKTSKRFLQTVLISTVIVLGFFDHYFLTLQQGQLLLALVFGIYWSI